ncbi:unnamed protein product [Rotaria sp. Silwood2]|nr:unnamed protein product [Rotaria sp. Silwood2]CAF4604068.1 unnamed protein product [Rotaria sp. Silwood2]
MCSLFVLFQILINRKLRSAVKNHVLIIFLILGLGSQLIDVPFYLYFIVHSTVISSNYSVCLIWWFIDIGWYNG